MPLLQDNKYFIIFMIKFTGVPVHHAQMSMIQLN